MCGRFKCGLHTRTRTDEKKRRYIELTKVGSEEEERRKEEGKRAAEHVSVQGGREVGSGTRDHAGREGSGQRNT